MREALEKAKASAPKLLQKGAFTIAELTELGDGCRSYLYNEIAAGRLRAMKRGRRTLVLAEDRAAWRASWPAIKPRKSAAR